ncbi:MAG: hypothetical protein K0R41_666, partial [Geminicoccaceae bacterium]|nr:hypothetical protein [Geminicoccaceae bacterium]
ARSMAEPVWRRLTATNWVIRPGVLRMAFRLISASTLEPRSLLGAMALASLSLPGIARADHDSLHSTPCDGTETVGGGQLGIAPGPVGPPDSLGWDLGSGQCNGSFTVVRDVDFPSPDGDGIELGMRAEQRSVGQVANGGGDYTVQTGADPTTGGRAWWNFQQSIAYDGNIGDLDALVFAIRVDASSAVAAPPTDMLAIRGTDRRSQRSAQCHGRPIAISFRPRRTRSSDG